MSLRATLLCHLIFLTEFVCPPPSNCSFCKGRNSGLGFRRQVLFLLCYKSKASYSIFLSFSYLHTKGEWGCFYSPTCCLPHLFTDSNIWDPGCLCSTLQEFWTDLYETWNFCWFLTYTKRQQSSICLKSQRCLFPISELTLTKRNRKELSENLLEIRLGFAAEPGLAASLCNWSDQLWFVEHAELAWVGSAGSWTVLGPGEEAPDPFSFPPVQTGGALCPGSAGWLVCGCSHSDLTVAMLEAAAAAVVAAASG